MAKLIYSVITSLDGYVADADGGFEWAAPGEEVHAFVNDQERPIGTYLYGRRIYEVMEVWEHADAMEDQRAVMQDYAAIWQGAEKVVFSSTLESVSTARTRIERTFDPALVEALKASSDRNLSVGGPTLAADALRAGLVDECHVFLNPVVVGGGTHWLPTGLRIDLELVDEHRFADGVVHLHHRVKA